MAKSEQNNFSFKKNDEQSSPPDLTERYFIINNEILIEHLNKAICIYNENATEQISLIENNEIKCNDLNKIQNFSIKLKNNMSLEEINSLLEDLSIILPNMNLRMFSIETENCNLMEIDISFLEMLNQNIQSISIYGIDLSNFDSKIFNTFPNLNSILLVENNIKDIDFIKQINIKEIFLLDNPLFETMNLDVVQLIEERIINRSGNIAFTFYYIWTNFIGNSRKKSRTVRVANR